MDPDYTPDTERHNERDAYQIPDKRRAPELVLRMRCPKCLDEFDVDVFLGVPLHANCPGNGSNPFHPILEPIPMTGYLDRRRAEAVLVKWAEEVPAQARGRGGEML